MPPPPLLGYNNNVRHRGRIFHIQTEDSGVASPRIKTHLFADGGRIVRSTRTDYSEHVGQPDMVEKVKNLMKEQHKAMFVALRSGQLDGAIGFEEGAPPAVPSGDGLASEPEFATSPGLPIPSTKIAEMPSPASVARPSGAVARAPSSTATPQSAPAPEPAPLPTENGEGSERPYAAPRPSAIFTVAPSSGSIFGDVGIDEKSLDDAILSYLAEDPKKKD